jgi:hypothetical protein
LLKSLESFESTWKVLKALGKFGQSCPQATRDGILSIGRLNHAINAAAANSNEFRRQTSQE